MNKIPKSHIFKEWEAFSGTHKSNFGFTQEQKGKKRIVTQWNKPFSLAYMHFKKIKYDHVIMFLSDLSSGLCDYVHTTLQSGFIRSYRCYWVWDLWLPWDPTAGTDMRTGQQMNEAFKGCWTEQIANMGLLKIRHLKQSKTKTGSGSRRLGLVQGVERDRRPS